ncbi:hypothetical protein B9Z55_025706 [Caenorhabditis nigoni]|uniref:Uncharacterized protein n=2 Tax=Caenorhabditis nigoni TaxID=1611254 RepID=A0A2G5SZU7_9PELO|nr:hypothetical protein B9Z55_025706 [Caenorhabditis nigoni]
MLKGRKMWKAPPPPAAAANPRGPQVDLSAVEAARQEHHAARIAHHKVSEKARRLQEKKEGYDENIRGLTESMNAESCPEKKKNLEDCIKKQKKIRSNCLKKVKEAMMMEESARVAMEDDEDQLAFKAISSGACYEDNREWKLRK